MKKSKRLRQAEAAVDKAGSGEASAAPPKSFLWWPWAAAVASLLLAFQIYGPSLNGPYVLDDLAFPYADPKQQGISFLHWVLGTRPLLMASFWLNHTLSGDDPFSFHATNVVLHLFTSVVVALAAMRLVEWAGGAGNGGNDGPGGKTSLHSKFGVRAAGIFAGALFLVHPVNTESVAYVASRSETLSVLLYFSAYCVFLYRRTESITLGRALAVLALFGAAVATKQHTLTLPLLLLLTDLFWPQGSVRANRLLYILLGIAGACGAWFVWSGLRIANTAGFHVAGISPFTYFCTELRVVWDYVRMFVLPFGLNADPDIQLSHSLTELGTIVGLGGWVAALAAAWVYRKRWPLASFGIFVFLLLIAPTSSVVPISEPFQERRLYLPFLGLPLVALEFLRRVEWTRRLMIEVPVLLVMAALTYQRSAVWSSPFALWTDTVAKSPKKVRPRFQLAQAYFDAKQYPQASENFEIAANLAPPDYRLLVNYGLALDRGQHYEAALAKFRQAAALEADPEVWSLIGQVYGQMRQTDEAFEALDRAQAIDPGFEMTYAIRGNVYESLGNAVSAADQYRRALSIDPYNDGVRQALDRVQGH